MSAENGLHPCPFCGRKPTAATETTALPAGGVEYTCCVFCTDLYHRAAVSATSLDNEIEAARDAADTWNRRAEAASTQPAPCAETPASKGETRQNSTSTQLSGVLSFWELSGMFAGLVQDMRGPIPSHRTDRELLDGFARRAVDVWNTIQGHLRNVCKMREALEAVARQESSPVEGIDRDAMCGRCTHAKIMFDDCKHDGSCWVDKVVNALASPPRNVDLFATAKEAETAFHEGGGCPGDCGECAFNSDAEVEGNSEWCEVNWMFATAERKDGGK